MAVATPPGTPALLRALNDRTALGLLLEHGVLTRNRLGELSGLSKPTASQMMQRLEAAGLIEAVGEISGGRGPNAIGYGVRADRIVGVAVDVRAEVITATVVDASGTENPVVTGTRGDTAAVEVRAVVARACAAASVDPPLVRVVAIGIPGSVDPSNDALNFADSLEGWPKTGVTAELAAALGCDVVIENDVKLAAVAERHEGSAAETGGFALLWMGEGLGLAVDLAGVVHRGAAGGAGEIGYLPVPREAAPLDSDARDLQDLIGGATIAQLVRDAGGTGETDDELVASLAAHPAALEALAPRIAIGIVPILAILDPEVVVLGGPAGAAGGPALAELVSGAVAAASHWTPRVIATAVSHDPVLRGAREVLLHEVRERLFAEVGALP